MRYDSVVNFVTVTKRHMLEELPGGYGTLRTTGVRIWHILLHRAGQRSQLLLKSPTDLD